MKDRVVELRRVRARDLSPDSRNWRKPPEAQQTAVRALMDRVGNVGAIIARQGEDGRLHIVDGHLRAGLDPDAELPVLVVDLDEAEAGEVLATLDPLGAMAEADHDALRELLAAVPAPADDALPGFAETFGAALESVGYSPPAPEPPSDVDAAPDPPSNPVTKPGDLWTLGRHRLGCGDSREGFTRIGVDISDGLVLTDPPYGIGIVKSGRVRQPGGKPAGLLRGKVGVPGVVEPRLYAPVTGDDAQFDPTWLLGVGTEQVIFGAQYYASRLADGTAWICWDKGIPEAATFSGFELAWTSLRGRNRIYRHRWSGMVRAGRRDVELADRVHPTQKPVGLLTQIIRDLGEGFRPILDPYSGSASCLIACELLERDCVAMEIEPAYCDVTVERWETLTGGKATRASS